MKAFVFLLTLLVTQSVAAQHGFGVRGGVNLSNLQNGGGKDLLSFCAGFYYQYQENTPVTLRAELSYSVQGSELASTMKLDYVHIAGMARFHYGPVSIHLGPQLGVLVVATYADNDVTKDFKPLDIDLNVGVGIEIPGGTEFGARYVMGFSDITKDSQTNYQNQLWQLTVSFPFHGHGHARREAPKKK